MFEDLLGGFANVFTPIHIIMLFVGVFIGILGGAIPGISGTMLVVILLPVAYGLDPIPALLLLTAVYTTSVFSGSISAILFNTPGTPEAVATVFDGYEMTKKGKPGEALGVAIFSSATGGLIGCVFLIILTPVLASFALNFSSPEYFSLIFLALVIVSVLGGGSFVKGMIGVLIGLLIATVGLDSSSGVARFTFDVTGLRSGIDFVAVIIGLFALAEVLRKVQEDYFTKEKTASPKTKFPGLGLLNRLKRTIGQSSLLGFFIGILPGVGATSASLVSYSMSSSFSKDSKSFGTGIPEGVAAPESANNSAAMGAIVPLLALGIPGSATTAVILGAFIMNGVQPGPLLIEQQGILVYTIIGGLLLANISVIIFSKPFISIFSYILRAPYYIIGPMIVIFCFIGTYAVRNSMLDLVVMVIAGIIGYNLTKAKFPLAPMILGLVLGTMIEDHFRRALIISGGDFSIFFTRPISAVLLVLAFLSLLIPMFKWYRRRILDKKDKVLPGQ
ncbi:tripartite tricarboxylate transporter permease [Lacicoccus alkaliphilus]|uniref:Putative tricarboxylic transport membrane protein n=1 Tax=Lacicoccus alkaliphilus DSM 16010 TaxID=1123231 RepID=A0A1M7JX44_9BACL|nr:tripartite tricarboxylate transporter permease [Salinicoccus alkaliphilus]SHM57554.1 putative tricarboxylic transport membrane protein [Salinicoccus alkaliphilus DSM 16010]